MWQPVEDLKGTVGWGRAGRGWKWGHGGSERVSDLPEVTQQVRKRNRLWVSTQIL